MNPPVSTVAWVDMFKTSSLNNVINYSECSFMIGINVLNTNMRALSTL